MPQMLRPSSIRTPEAPNPPSIVMPVGRPRLCDPLGPRGARGPVVAVLGRLQRGHLQHAPALAVLVREHRPAVRPVAVHDPARLVHEVEQRLLGRCRQHPSLRRVPPAAPVPAPVLALIRHAFADGAGDGAALLVPPPLHVHQLHPLLDDGLGLVRLAVESWEAARDVLAQRVGEREEEGEAHQRREHLVEARAQERDPAHRAENRLERRHL
mmetsp:Transcript_12320/g.29457  ORF Transcript_12320/g.29457 Transcript_12320/m.29457 type:complete len:212 (-) Transcript_12320:2442-3077(-)